MSDPLVRVHVHENVGTVILNRADKRNALNRAVLEEIDQAFGDLHLERRVRAVVITGAGSAFCAGMDLGEMLSTSQALDAESRWAQDATAYQDILETMLRFPKPIIAAVNGPAVAGGAGLVMAADIVIASDDAKIGFPEPLRGLVAGIVSPLLAFRVGGGHATRLLLTAVQIDASEGHRIGLFHEIVAHDKLWARAVELAGQTALSAPDALQLTKRMIYETVGSQLPTLLSAGAAISATARSTEAAAEGMASFLQHRKPQWP